MVEIERATRETRVRVRLEAGRDGAAPRAAVPDDLLRHMLESLARWGGLALEVEATGDLRHHLVEDVAITLGRALRELADPERCERVGHAVVPMDEALVLVAVDLVERPFFQGEVPDALLTHFLQSLAFEGRFSLHVQVLRGAHEHHVSEAAFKALGLALRRALEPRRGVSTKGRARVRRR